MKGQVKRGNRSAYTYAIGYPDSHAVYTSLSLRTVGFSRATCSNKSTITNMSRDAGPQIVPTVIAKLRDLLAKAKNIKTISSIDPPLSTNALSPDISVLTKSTEPIGTSDSELALQNASVECAARAILYEKIGAHDVQDPDFVDVWNLLDIIQACSNQKQCDPGLTLWLVEEMLDSQTIDGCRYVLDYLKSRRADLIGQELTINKRNTILRTCNELLRRLSRVENAVFCGDVFVFLFQVFPLGDKSAVNLRGEFHVENTTTFDPPAPATDTLEEKRGTENGTVQASELMELDQDSKQGQLSAKDDENSHKDSVSAKGKQNGAPAGSKDRGSQQKLKPEEQSTKKDRKPSNNKPDAPNSRDLYPDFWSLQHIFSNPQKAFDIEAFAGFRKGLEVTLRKFTATPKVPRVSGHSRKRKREEEEPSDLASTFNPKYLTSRDLFDLELSDLTFQRHVLVQALVLLEFLLSLTPQAKKKTEQLKAQRSMIFNHTLSENDTKWCLEMKSAIGKYLQEAPDGKLYYRMVDNVISRDKNWVTWKIESCQDIKRPPIPLEEFIEAEASAKRLCKSGRMKSRPMGAIDLDFLQEDAGEDGLERLRSGQANEVPRLDVLVKEVQNADLDLEMVNKETEPQEWASIVSKRASRTWRALRLVSKKIMVLASKVDEREGLDLILESEQPKEPAELMQMQMQDAAESTEEARNEQSKGNDVRDPVPDAIHEAEQANPVVTAVTG